MGNLKPYLQKFRLHRYWNTFSWDRFYRFLYSTLNYCSCIHNQLDYFFSDRIWGANENTHTHTTHSCLHLLSHFQTAKLLVTHDRRQVVSFAVCLIFIPTLTSLLLLFIFTPDNKKHPCIWWLWIGLSFRSMVKLIRNHTIYQPAAKALAGRKYFSLYQNHFYSIGRRNIRWY